ncbi:MAG: carbohydrate porin [Candidatus Omnitrophota bacterium]|jgi:porin
MLSLCGRLRVVFCAILLIPLFFSLAYAGGESGWLTREYLTGNWFGFRDKLADSGITFASSYVVDILNNPVGGKRENRVRYDSSLGLDLNADLGKLMDFEGWQFHIAGVYRQGRNLSKDIGNRFVVSSIYGSEQFRLYSLYLDKALMDGRLSFRFGRLGAGDDFASSPLYWNFVNNAIDGNPISIPINIPFTAYPTATWAALVKYKITPEVLSKTGIYNGDDRVGDNKYHGMDFSFRSDKGVMLLQEFSYLLNQAEGSRGLPGNYKIGGIYDTGKFEDFYKDENGNSAAVTGLPKRKHRGTYGFYLHGDQMVYREGGQDSKQGLTVFTVFTFAPPDVNEFSFFVDGGLVYTGLIPKRDKDVTSLGFAYGKWSEDLANYQNDSGQDPQKFEVMMELNYKFMVSPCLYLQPVTQYIFNPGGARNIDDALVVGTRVGVIF